MAKEFEGWLAGGIRQILDLAKPDRELIGGLEYRNGRLILPPRVEQALDLSTLTGLSDYIRNPRDGIDANKVGIIHVDSPWMVRYLSALDPLYRTREVYATAEYEATRMFRFNEKLDIETFVIQSMATLEDSGDRARMLEIVGKIKVENAITVEDDGYSQTAAIREGISLERAALIKNPYRLTPFRTFAEVPQVESPFVLRLFKGKGTDSPVYAGLFECDNGKWKADAVAEIKKWLTLAIASTPGDVDVPIFA